jgi:hypothetical protein
MQVSSLVFTILSLYSSESKWHHLFFHALQFKPLEPVINHWLFRSIVSYIIVLNVIDLVMLQVI